MSNTEIHRKVARLKAQAIDLRADIDSLSALSLVECVYSLPSSGAWEGSSRTVRVNAAASQVVDKLTAELIATEAELEKAISEYTEWAADGE